MTTNDEEKKFRAEDRIARILATMPFGALASTRSRTTHDDGYLKRRRSDTGLPEGGYAIDMDRLADWLEALRGVLEEAVKIQRVNDERLREAEKELAAISAVLARGVTAKTRKKLLHLTASKDTK